MRGKARPWPGWFITFEGGDGAGKTVQLRALAAFLRKNHVAVVETREPGGSRLSEAVRELVLDPDHDNMGARAELLLMLAARAQHVDETIVPALQAGSVVLCDRYGDATYAYQHGGRGLDKGVVLSMHDFAADGCKPDLTFLLDLDPQAAKGRMATRVGNDTRIDAEPAAFHARVRQAYLDLAKREVTRFRVLDASKSVGIIQDRIQTAVKQKGVVGRR